MDERALRSLLDLQPEEELQLTHHTHLELPGHLLRKLGDKSEEPPKIISSTYI